MDVGATIERLSDLTLDASCDRQVEACFYLSSRFAPFYRDYAHRFDKKTNVRKVRDHLLQLWSHKLAGSRPSQGSAAALEALRPYSGEMAAEHAETAISCALHLAWYLINRNESSVRGCVLNYFDHIEYIVSERFGRDIVRELSDIMIIQSRLFRAETAAYEQALLDPRPMMSRPLLIKNLDRDVAGRL